MYLKVLSRPIVLRITIVCLLLLSGLFMHAQEVTSTMYHRYLTKSLQYGVGMSSVFDTYLSPLSYKGTDFRVVRETMRLSRLGHQHLSVQNLLQANLSYVHNPADNNKSLAGMVNWNYGLHYQFRLTDHFKLLAGGLLDLNGGFIYNFRNGNNPASARLFANLDASAMAIWHVHIKRYPLVLRYQINLPFIGLMFSPHYGQSYYEIFSLGNSAGVVQFTSLHNQPSLRQMLSVDFPVGRTKMRVSYLSDIQQSHVNGLKTHYYARTFMIGFVRELSLLHPHKQASLPLSIKAY